MENAIPLCQQPCTFTRMPEYTFVQSSCTVSKWWCGKWLYPGDFVHCLVNRKVAQCYITVAWQVELLRCIWKKLLRLGGTKSWFRHLTVLFLPWDTFPVMHLRYKPNVRLTPYSDGLPETISMTITVAKTLGSNGNGTRSKCKFLLRCNGQTSEMRHACLRFSTWMHSWEKPILIKT